MHRSKRYQPRRSQTATPSRAATPTRLPTTRGTQPPIVDFRPFVRDLEALESHLRRLLASTNEEVTVAAMVILTEARWLSMPPTVPELDQLLGRVYEAMAAFPLDGAIWEEVRVLTRRVVRTARMTRYRTLT